MFHRCISRGITKDYICIKMNMMWLPPKIKQGVPCDSARRVNEKSYVQTNYFNVQTTINYAHPVQTKVKTDLLICRTSYVTVGYIVQTTYPHL